MKNILRIAIVSSLAAGAAGAAEAADGAVAIAVENDIPSGSDRDYTNGLRLAYISPEGKGGALARKLFGAGENDAVRFSIGAGQNIYTPEYYALPAPPPGQHPYAGWLYADGALLIERGHRGIVDIVSATIGVVGPASLAEQAQKTTHRITSDPEPLGWDNQLRNEPGVILSFDRLRRAKFLLSENVDGEIAPFAGVAAGNVLTEARAGAVFRLGENLGGGFGPARVRSAIPSFGASGARGFSWSIFGGAAMRAKARDIFLDGNTFVDSASVEKKNLVGEFQIGATLGIDNVRLSYTHVFQTRQYDTEPEGHRFGALSLTVGF